MSISRRICSILFLSLGVIGTTTTKKHAQFNAVVVQQKKMDRVGFEPTTSAMPMPYPTGLDDRPCNNSRFWNDIKMIRLGLSNEGQNKTMIYDELRIA